MVRVWMLFLMALVFGETQAMRTESLLSPNGDIKVDVTIADSLLFTVSKGQECIISSCVIGLQLPRQQMGVKPRLKSVKRDIIDETLHNAVPIKNADTPNKASRLTLSFQGNYDVEFRAYDHAVAYRFVLKGKGTADVMDEKMVMDFPTPFTAHLSKTKTGFWTSYEYPYSHLSTKDYGSDDEMTYLPVLLETPQGTKILLSESDVRDYPAMFLKGTARHGLEAVFPRSPKKWEPYGDRGFLVTEEHPYLASTSANRPLPWRFLVVGDDADIVSNEMERILGGTCELEDTNWIKPGKVSWDWWNHWTVWNVDFVTGINNATYRYFIDFASAYGIDYILLDEGWCKDVSDPYTTRDDIDVRQLVEYGREKGVGVLLWLTWLTVEQHMDLIAHYADMGVKGLKIDFMDHSDQWMVNYYERVAKECARHKMIVDFHGSFKPAGLEIRYPNVLSYEGVLGMEQGRGCHPDNTIWLPFIRNAVGPMDFTPGSMASAQPEDNNGTGSLPMGSGTRAYQMALYVVFESALQMLADSPTRYINEEECTRFIAMTPTTWDESRVLSAKAGSHYVVARRKGRQWFVGAITGSNPQDLTISLDFLEQGGELQFFQDGANAHRIAVDYKKGRRSVTPSDSLRLHLARNGGWCGVIQPQ